MRCELEFPSNTAMPWEIPHPSPPRSPTVGNECPMCLADRRSRNFMGVSWRCLAAEAH